MVDVSGPNGPDGVPDLSFGRLPARTVQEAEILVGKILAYDTMNYRGSALLVSDKKDGKTSFIQPNEDLIKALGWTNVTTAYRDQVPSASIRSTVNSTINAGVALVNYVGHSDYNFWGGYETVYATADMDSLANAGKPTVVMQWGCWNNYYVNSKNTTMSHRFLVTGPTGAAGVFGSATRSPPSRKPN